MVISGGKYLNLESCKAVGQSTVSAIMTEFKKVGVGSLQVTFECATNPIDVEKVNQELSQ